MADIELKRIVDLVPQSDIDDTVYTIIDSVSGGIKKYPIGSFICSVAPMFDATVAYAKGNYCNYGGQLYKFTAAHAAGSWTGSDAIAVSVAECLEAIEDHRTDSGLTEDIKQALLQIAAKVAYIDDDGEDYYTDLQDALYPPVPATAISLNTNSLSFATLNTTQSLTATVTPSDTTEEVEWESSDTSIATVDEYGVVTALDYGSCTITATAGNVSATCSVVVSQVTLSSISAVYTQSGTVYDTDSLDSLKSDLVVTATWSDTSTSTVASADYSLSGTLASGTSTITVSYGGKTTTFSVTVTSILHPFENGTHTFTDTPQVITVTDGDTATLTLSAGNNKDMFANISNVSNNTTARTSTDNFKNGGVVWATIPANATVYIKATVVAIERKNTNAVVNMVLRDVNADSVWSVFSNTRIDSLSIGDYIENETTFENSADVSCVSSYFGGRGNTYAATIGLKVEMYVNGVKWV